MPIFEERRILRSVTTTFDPPGVNVCHADVVLRDGVSISEVVHRTTYGLEHYERMIEEFSHGAQAAALLGWTPAAAVARRKHLADLAVEADRAAEAAQAAASRRS